jgi:hypothetical protein
MKKRGVRYSIVVVALVAACMVSTSVCLLHVGAAAASPPAQPNAPAVAASKEACLNCHGPFDKLVANVNYQAPSEEKITPHRYVAHSAKEAKAIPECSNCHEPHPVPPVASGVAALPKPDVQWCYTTCHHKNTFQLCKDCHK